MCSTLDWLHWSTYSAGSVSFCSPRVSREIECSATCGEEHMQASPAQTVVERYQTGLGRSCCPQAFTPLLDGHMTFPEAKNIIHPLSDQMRLVSPNVSQRPRLNCIPHFRFSEDFPGGSDGKASAYNVGDLGSVWPWGHKESDTIERLHFLSFQILGIWESGLSLGKKVPHWHNNLHDVLQAAFIFQSLVLPSVS